MKKIFLATLIVFFFIPAISQVVIITKSEIVEQHNGKYYYVHTVSKGQTVYSIAKEYDVTVDEVYFENPDSKQGISIDQTLLIPTVNRETKLKNDVNKTDYNFFYHVSANNETYKHISSIYSIPEKYIIKANPDLVPPLREGEYVKIPVKEAFDILDGKTDPSLNNTQKKNENYNPYSKSQTVDHNTQGQKSQVVSFNPEISVIPDYRHIVISGETTNSIALKYGIPVEMLMAVNPGLDNNVIIGERLRIPDKTKIKKSTNTTVLDTQLLTKEQKPQTQESQIIKHKVKKKETLYSIGREYGVTVSELMKANNGLTKTISPGQIILIPHKTLNEPYIIHIADKNTKSNKIAKLYQIPVYQIVEFNPNLGKRIYKNDEIKIPVGKNATITPISPENDELVIIPEEPNIIKIDTTKIDLCSFVPDTNRRYKVALMIPLSLEEADSINKEQFLLSYQKHFIPFRFIQFYEGALIALDSLTKQGMKVEMYIYDVDKNLTKTAKVLQQRELRTMDLIIGPFYNDSFNQIALFAGNFNIPIINPLSYREAIVNDYSSVIKVKPNIYAQLPMIETFIDKFAKTSKVFLISQTSYIDANYVIEINNRIIPILEPEVKISNEYLFDLSYLVAERDTLFNNDSLPPPYLFEGTNIYSEILENNISDSTIINNSLIKINYAIDSLHPFLDNASTLRNNLVILYGTKKSFVLDVLNRLNESRDTFDIQLVGMPTWERMSNLSNIKMNNLRLSYFSSNYIDYNSDITQDFIYKFRNEFNMEPNEYAYSGFDITFYFLSALFNLGDSFNECLESFPMELLKTKYQYKRVANTNNFENEYWNMLKLNNMATSKIPDEIILQNEQ